MIRKALFVAAFALVLVFVLPEAWTYGRAIFEQWRAAREQRADRERTARMQALNARPPAVLPERSSDRATFPRESFSVSYMDAKGFAVDTRSGTVTQDRIIDPDSTVAMRLSRAELDTLYEDALHGGLFEMPQPAQIMEAWATAGDYSGMLTVRADTASNTLHWSPWSPNYPWSDDHKRLNAYVGKLKRMVYANPDYRALPRPRGWYID